MKQNKQEKAPQTEKGTTTNQKGKGGAAAKNADMTKGHDGAVNEHNIRADKKAPQKKDSKK